MRTVKSRTSGLTESQFGFLLVVPAIAVFAVVMLYPFVSSIVMSFTNRSLLLPGQSFTGLDNYRDLLADPNFLGVFYNTIVFVVAGTFFPFVLGLIWSIVLQQGFKGSSFLRSLTLVNWVLPGTAIGFLWMWVFQGNYGIVNGMLTSLGLIDQHINWLGSTEYAMLVVTVAATWKGIPWFMAFLFGGLLSIPREHIEAARIDGAGNWTVFSRVVYPALKPVMIIVILLGAIGNLQLFDLFWVMTEGGPARATTTLAVEVYRSAFREWNLGKAAAIGVVWVVLLSAFAFFYLRGMRDEVK